MFPIIKRNKNFYNDVYVHLLCEFFVVSIMMKGIVILFLEFFTMYFEVHIMVICNNHESDVGMNGIVKFVET
jgi:hypothetical protein